MSGTFKLIFIDKKSKRSHKIVEIKVFLKPFCLLMERSGSGSVQNNDGSGRPKNITDPTDLDPDPDPQHWF
jgi:hypothetical protein